MKGLEESGQHIILCTDKSHLDLSIFPHSHHGRWGLRGATRVVRDISTTAKIF